MARLKTERNEEHNVNKIKKILMRTKICPEDLKEVTSVGLTGSSFT